jgi:hypothetical protein
MMPVRFVAATCLLLAATAAHAQMSLPGKFEVTDTGSASYTIPISIVPGTAGLEPKLSLQYDSRSGNGLLGVGWSLAGLPAITRCGRTIAQDGQVGGVSYDANDRFCLDGQRLIATSGTYGADQTEYRTERESFSKVVSYGSAGSGPSWFKVWTKAGLVMEFGNTADSRIEAQGKASVRVWALNRTSDTKSNFFTVSYTEDNANGEYRPDRIDYTGNAAANTQPQNSVRFVYEPRASAPDLAFPSAIPDATPLYEAGGIVKTTQRLKLVKLYRAEILAHEYRLVYETSPATKRSRLISVARCADDGGCLPATTFSWSDGGAPFTYSNAGNGAYTQAFYQPDASAGPFWMSNGSTTYAVDVNGDGRTDFVQISKAAYSAQVLVSNGDGTFTRTLNQTGQANGPFWPTDSYNTFAMDVNGDGRIDFLQTPATATSAAVHQVLRANTDGTYTQMQHSTSSPFWEPPTIPADVDGDGLSDIVQFRGAPYTTCSGSRACTIVHRSNGDGTFTMTFLQMYDNGPFWSLASYNTFPLDFDGDGRIDFMQIPNANNNASAQALRADWSAAPSQIYFSTGTVFTQAYVSSGSPYWDQPVFPIDVNGDGRADILQVRRDTYHRAIVQLSKGDGTVAQGFYQPDHVYGPIMQLLDGEIFPVEYNGDGKTDLLQIATGPNYPGQSYARLNMAHGPGPYTEAFYQSSTANGPFWRADTHATFTADVNGDGRTDIVQINKTAAQAQVVMPSGGPADQLRTVTHGNDSLTQIAYTTLSGSGPGYTRDTGVSACTYPCIDVQGPLYVVSEVKSSNGLGIAGAGGEYRSTYRYAGAKADQHGRGFLGFRQMVVRDEQTGVEQVTTYRQDYPFTGLVAAREKTLGTQLLNRSSNSYAATDLGGTRRYPFLTSSLEESWELTGAALPAVTTAYQYDSFGNATQVGVSTGDGHAKTTTNTYSNDATSWLLGRLTRSEVTSTTPGN